MDNKEAASERQAIDIAAEFRADAERLGVTLSDEEAMDKKHHYFDLNMGAIRVEESPAKVFDLVELSSRYEDEKHPRELGMLLSLVTSKNEWDAYPEIVWRRPGHVENPHDDKWITLRDWMKEQGFDPDVLTKKPSRDQIQDVLEK